MSSVVLHNYYRSSASYRVRIALHWKAIPFEYRAVSLVRDGGQHLTEEYRKVNPLRAVPTLVVDGHTLSESMAILEYLEETHPQPALLPRDPFQRAAVRRRAEAINAGIQPLQNLHVLKKIDADFRVGEDGKKAWAAHFIARGFDGLEPLLAESAGTYSVGDEVSFADVCLVPQVFAARRFDVDLARYPTIARVEAALAKLPQVQAAHPGRQPDCPPDQRVP